eukprot:364165-Chlamydomonas_euryale.AAC.15
MVIIWCRQDTASPLQERASLCVSCFRAQSSGATVKWKTVWLVSSAVSLLKDRRGLNGRLIMRRRLCVAAAPHVAPTPEPDAV